MVLSMMTRYLTKEWKFSIFPHENEVVKLYSIICSKLIAGFVISGLGLGSKLLHGAQSKLSHPDSHRLPNVCATAGRLSHNHVTFPRQINSISNI